MFVRQHGYECFNKFELFYNLVYHAPKNIAQYVQKGFIKEKIFQNILQTERKCET